ncbi:glyoxalase superfamily protein [Mesorhizobium sp. 1M-11]|uniref:VOC family protein n=1 Tax=Mesorhizobium sp. 1M-11 TaxID=1529006 RepID=UPI0006C74552|nr:glyoxalase superfamily protein [Mesorhizobium sp. 1M-11]
MTEPTTHAPSLTGVVPILGVRDLQRALEFYRSVLGFEVSWTFGTPVTLAAVCRDKVEFNLSETGDAFQRSRAYVYVDNVDAYYDRIAAAGARVLFPLEDRAYGMRDCRIADPDGNEISFGSISIGPDAA